MLKTVLVVDDDAIFHFLMKKMLAQSGVLPDSIQTASTGKEALDKMTDAQRSGIPLPDIIFLDLNMPMMGGFEFMEAYKKLSADHVEHTKIFIISSSLNGRDAERAMLLGADKFLVKPVSEMDLKQILL